MGEVWILGLGVNPPLPFPASLALEVGHLLSLVPLPCPSFFPSLLSEVGPLKSI